MIYRAVLFLSLAISSCGMPGRELPETRPDNMVVQLYDGGGMMPEGDEYFLSEDSCYAKFWRGNVTNWLRFKLRKGQLDTLYKAFYENEFERIRTEEMETYDRGGVTIYLRFGDKRYSVSNSGSTYIKKRWKAAFNKVAAAVLAAAAPIVEERQAPLTVHFSKEMLADSLSLYFSVGDFYYTSDSGKKETATFTLMRGLHPFQVGLMRNTQPLHARTSKASLEDILTVCGQNDTLFFSMPDSVHIQHRKNVDCVQ